MKKDLTLLYVEDDAVVRENFAQIFKDYFSVVLTTESGDEALEIYKNNHIDVGIFDVQLKGMDGITLAGKIKELNPELIILLISAYSDAPKLLKAINLQLFGYLVKPVQLNELIHKIEEIIDTVSKENILKLSNDYSWDKTSYTLYIDSEAVKLTKKESQVIRLLLANKNNYMSACEIQAELFDKEEKKTSNCNNTVQLLSRLKKKLETISQHSYFIENCYGVGYKISV